MSVTQGLARLFEAMLLLPALPFAAAFTTGFTVVNRSGRPIRVTPVGRYRSGERGLLPLVQSRGWPMSVDHDLRLPVGCDETIEVFYNWDGVRLTELVVEAEGGGPVQLATPPAERFEITDLGSLAALGPEVRAAFARALEPRRPHPLAWLLVPLTGCVLVLLTPVLLLASLAVPLVVLPFFVYARGRQGVVGACDGEAGGEASLDAGPGAAPDPPVR